MWGEDRHSWAGERLGNEANSTAVAPASVSPSAQRKGGGLEKGLWKGSRGGGEAVVPDWGPTREVAIENRSGQGAMREERLREHWDFPECEETGSESLGPCLLCQGAHLLLGTCLGQGLWEPGLGLAPGCP